MRYKLTSRAALENEPHSYTQIITQTKHTQKAITVKQNTSTRTDPATMYSIKALAIIAIFGLTQSTLALPQDFSAVATVPPDDISKYTVQVSTSD